MNRFISIFLVTLAVLGLSARSYAQNNFKQIVFGTAPNTATVNAPVSPSGTFTFPSVTGSFEILSTGGGQTVNGTQTATANDQILAGLRLAPSYVDGAFTGVLHAALLLGSASAAGNMFIADGGGFYGIINAPTLTANQTYTLSPAGGSLITMTGGVSGTQLWNAGDLLYANANGSSVTRLAKGGNSTALVVDGSGTFGWSGTLPALNGSNLTNLNATNITGGTINSTYLPTGTVIANGTPATGDMLYWSGTQWDRLPVGAHANGEVLSLVSGSPNWAAAGSGGNTFSSINLTGASNQINLQPNGAGNAFVFTATNPGQATTIRWDDPGVASTGIVYTHNSGIQDVVGNKTFQNLGMHDSVLTGVTGTLLLNAANTSMFTLSSAAADFTIGKITGGYDGKRLRIYNKSGKNMTIKNGAGTDSIYTYANGDITLTADGALSLVHDGTRWTGDSYTANNVIGTIGSSTYAIDGRTLGQDVSTTTLTNQDSLHLDVQGGQVWEIQGTLIVSGSLSNSDMNWTVLTPASSTQTISYSSYKASGGASSLQGANVLTTSGASLGVNVGTSTTFVDFRGLIIVGTTGTIRVQYAATNGTVNMAKNSYMRATRIR